MLLVWYSGTCTLPHGTDIGDISMAKLGFVPPATLPILVSTSDSSCFYLFSLLLLLWMKYLPTQQYRMYKMRMQAIRTAIISITPNSDPDDLQLHSELSSFAIVSNPKFVCDAWINLSVIPFSYKRILFSNLLFLAFTSSSWLEQDCPIVIEGLIEAMLTLETFNLLIPFSDFLSFIRPDLLFTTSSLLSWPESALSVAFS